jgi:hypothetical protein
MRTSIFFSRCLVSSLLIVAAAACKDEAKEKGEVLARETIGPMGGSISGGGLTLQVPAGALTADTELELRVSKRDLSARDYAQEGAAIDIFPEGTRLRLPAELTFSDGPESPAVLFTQDDLTVAANGSTAWINELGTAALASAGIVTVEVLEPALGTSPSSAGMTHRDAAHFRVALTETPRFNVAMTLYDTEDYYDKPINGTGQGEGDCGFELGTVLGGSLAGGCSDGPLTATIGVTSAEIQFDIAPYQSGKLETPVVVGLIGGSDDLAFQLGFFSFDTGPCYAETCSGYGVCEVQGANAVCACNEGYAPGEGLTCECVPNCAGRQCGGDGCGGGCAPGCSDGEFCDDGSGQCVPDGSETTDPTDAETTDPTDAETTDPTDAETTDPTDATTTDDPTDATTSTDSTGTG